MEHHGAYHLASLYGCAANVLSCAPLIKTIQQKLLCCAVCCEGEFRYATIHGTCVLACPQIDCWNAFCGAVRRST